MADLELTVKQASRSLAISPRTVRRWLNSGKLHGRRVDRGNLSPTWRVSEDSVRRVAADVKQRTDSPDEGAGQSAVMVSEVLDEVRSLREENTEYRAVIGHLAERVGALEATIQRLLPPPAEEEPPPRSWWKFW